MFGTSFFAPTNQLTYKQIGSGEYMGTAIAEPKLHITAFNTSLKKFDNPTVGSVVVSNSRIPHFVLHTAPGLAIYILSIVFCIIRRGEAVLETIILVSVEAVVLAHHSLYSMQTQRDFSLCELLSINVILVACVYIPNQVFHPFAKLSISIYAFLVAIAFAGRIYMAETFFINNQFDDPIGAAVIVHLIFLMNNPNREELTSRRAIRVPLRNP
ncbi:Bax inhibitor-1 family protein, putative [Theobroma cacao]|uniref:Bax inhibitor-1 family protein, putative n=1 Tax=Theobroma cacao TaxID=3641 RepID=S1SIC3_THECC|nr:Bax inhibitor-1 family protein, putative [Theobroma cacao]